MFIYLAYAGDPTFHLGTNSMTTAGGSDTESGANEGKSPAHDDRRLFRRYPVAVPAELDVNGERQKCAITDLSLGGVAVIPGNPALAGQECHLHCDDFYFEQGMRGRVVHTTSEVVHISFDLDEDMEGALTMFLVMSPATR